MERETQSAPTNAESQVWALARQRSLEGVLKSQKYSESSKKQLLKILETKLRTSFIAPLGYFEEHFGFMWGRGKKESELTEDELRYKVIWNSIRTNILNNGNNQIRAVHNELMQYTITWNRYQLNFEAKEPGKLVKVDKE